MAFLPVQALSELDWCKAGMVLAFAVLLWVLAIWAFNAGLKRYETHNFMLQREE
jgi:hypothetical protein